MASVHVFIVRIDLDAPGFRASARRVDEEVAGHFEQPQSLLEFLVRPLPWATDDRCRGVADVPPEVP